MRRTLRLFASVKPARYLEAGRPTGLTGVYTHNSPRSTLLYLYSTTLDKLKAAPESSLYRQSIEAQTKHRMTIVAAAEPPGYAEWAQRASKILEEHPDGFETAQFVKRGNEVFILHNNPKKEDERYEEWDGEGVRGELEGLRSEEERTDLEQIFTRPPVDVSKQIQWEPEPQLTADQ